MVSFASQQLSRMQRLAFLLTNRPHYVLGRFAIVRHGYSRWTAIKNAVVGQPRLKIGDLYEEATASIEIADSGHLIPPGPAARQVEELRTLSYSPGPHLSPSAVSQLLEAAHSQPLKVKKPAGMADEPTYAHLAAGHALRDRTAIATVRNSSALPIVRALAGDPLLYDIARSFLGYRPRQISSWLFWSLANGLSAADRRAAYQTIDFHYDVDGFNFMYANFYLVDTNRLNGAHVLIEGTANNKRLRDLVGSARLSDEEAQEAYGRNHERIMEGPAGYGFLEDSSCYHKALPPRAGDRLMLQFRYQ